MITTFLNDQAMGRFQNMHLTSQLVKSEFLAFGRLGYGLEYSAKATSFLEQKLNNKPIRAYFVSKIADWVMAEQGTLARLGNESDLEKLLKAQLPFIFEATITIQYLHNQILDAKAGVVTRERITENLLSANLLKDQLYRYIRQELPKWASAKVEKSIRRCFEYVDVGQALEVTANRYNAFTNNNAHLEELLPLVVRNEINLAPVSPFIDKLKADLPVFLHQQLDVYFHRIYLTCANLFVEATALIGELVQLPADKLKPILQFSVTYGLMRQLVNDNADWVPSHFELSTQDKVTSDNFSDLRNATLTLPLIFFLAAEKNSLLHNVLRNEETWQPEFEQSVFDTIIESKALFKSIQNTRILGELALAYLPQKNEAASYLADSCEIVHWNKFLVPCLKHPAYKAYRKTTPYKKTKQLIKRLRLQRIEDQQSVERSFQFKLSIFKTNRSSFPLAVQHFHQLLNKETSKQL